MSEIEEVIRSEKNSAKKKAESAAIKETAKNAARWNKWAEEEKPRIAQFRKEFDKKYPCLKGDYTVDPRKTPGYLKAPFVAVVEVRGQSLKISNDQLNFPDTEYTWFEIESDRGLKELIKKFIQERDEAEKRSQEYYDSLPIGNTD